ncbi:S49 family peptidase [Halovenus rubra]|uniref:S49 family peptidase n=2 Tax=Halovenus rubra TaxID=869890 RepID=A0ACC7DZT5_9EURY|nr:S49 family peptidase [Halovenus rubra]
MSSEETDSPATESSEGVNGSSSTGQRTPSETTSGQRYAIILLAAVAAVVAGVAVVSLAFGVAGSSAASDADGTVAVVSIEGPIMEPIGENLEDELREIRGNESIDAVVLKMNTPGGAPAPTERMYLSIQRTNKQMPVLASVQGLSASAGYYMMTPAEDIYALPSSQIGSVGLAASAPQPTPPVQGPSGPDKRGSNTIQQWAQLEALGNNFIETVMEQRGDRIELSREEVSTAKVFLGVTSVENGYADEIGSLDDAIEDAASRADLEEYQITEREVGGAQSIPIFAQTDSGIVAIYDEDPSIADIKPVDHALVYRPAVPRLEELETVSSPDIEEVVAKAVEENGGDDS